MRYLISEIEFYEPTVAEFKGKVVAIRRDQLEGEKLYIIPESVMNVAASFSKGEEEPSVIIPNFADIVIYLKAINASFGYDSGLNTISIRSDEESIELTYIPDKFIMEVAEFGPSARSLYDFLESLDLHIMVATTLPRTIDLNVDENVEKISTQEPEKEEPVEEKKDTSEKPSEQESNEEGSMVSSEEMEAVINDSKDDGKVVNVEVVDDAEEVFK